MNVAQLCQLILVQQQLQVDLVTGKADDLPLTDPFTAAGTTKFLDDVVQVLAQAQASGRMAHAQLIGTLEQGALLSGFQRSYEIAKRGRLDGWADSYTQLNRQVTPGGVLTPGSLLPSIGTKVDDEFVALLQGVQVS